jgi:hypothetical protein
MRMRGKSKHTTRGHLKHPLQQKMASLIQDGGLKWFKNASVYNTNLTQERTQEIMKTGNLHQKLSFFFLGLFYSYRKKKQLCRRNFFNSSPFSPRKLDLKIQKFFGSKSTGTCSVVVKKLSFQIEFSRRKRARIEKVSSTKLFLFPKRIK